MTTAYSTEQLGQIEQIKQLKARYFRFMDLKQWDNWGTVFTTDCVMEVPEANMIETGRQNIVAAVSKALIGTITTHHGHMPEIELTGVDTAKGIWAMFDYVEWKHADGTRTGLQGYGHYLEEYRVEDGQWRIQRLRLERLRIDPLS